MDASPVPEESGVRRRPLRASRLRMHAAALVGFSVLQGCGPASPDPAASTEFAAGASTQQQDALTVRVRALTDEEARRCFGGSLAHLGVQAVWIQIQNDGDASLRYLPILTDPEYFAPQEVAQQLHGWLSGAANARVDAAFESTAMPIVVPAHALTSGFIYTHADGGLKLVNVGLLAEGARQAWRFRFILPIAGRQYAVQRVDFRGLYPTETIEDLDLDGLHRRLQALPCCVTDKTGKGEGDPLNLVIVGDGIDTLFPFSSRGWHLNEPVDARSSLRMAKAFLLGDRYDTAPVSPLYLFGRAQDVALQKARNSVSRRNHLRLWLAPFTVQHRSVWIGQVSRDIGVKLTTQSWSLTTHRISPFVDQERDYVLQDLLLTGFVERAGFVSGVGATSPQHIRRNLTDDPYVTDGMRLVVFLGSRWKLPLDVEILPWERPHL